MSMVRVHPGPLLYMAKENISFLQSLESQLRQPEFGFLLLLKKEFPSAELYLVGGAVRDAALGRQSKDFDFVVRNVSMEKLQAFLAGIGIVNFVGKTFGVLKFVPHDEYEQFKTKELEPFDIALPRTENAGGSGAYRDVNVQSDESLSLESDLSRRDFTINAMAVECTIKNGTLSIEKLVDPFGGMEDLETKTIRAVGKSEERFQEDYTRMLRALRFVCELGFSLDKKTKTAITELIVCVNNKQTNGDWITPRETISKELIRAYVANPVTAFDLCDELGIHEALIPELGAMKKCPQPEAFHTEGDVFAHTRLALTKINDAGYEKVFGKEKADALLVFAVLLHDIGKPPTLKTPERDGTDRVRFDGHDEIGARMAESIADRLALSAMPEGTKYHIKKEHLIWSVRHHLLFLNDPAILKTTTIEKYFFNPNLPGDHLLRLGYCDGTASIPADGSTGAAHVLAMMERVKKIGIMSAAKKKLLPPLIDGNDVMKLLKIKPSKQVGDILMAVREEQLLGNLKNKKSAKEYVKKHFLPK